MYLSLKDYIHLDEEREKITYISKKRTKSK